MRIQDAIELIQKASECRDRLLIAIDGRGGAGKSTFAKRLASTLTSASIVEFDWFHFPQQQAGPGHTYDFERFKTEIAFPFQQPESTLKFKKYNWGYLVGKPDGIATESSVIPSPQTLIVEGCQTLAAELADFLDLRIWIDTDAAEAMRRGMHRDIHQYGLDPHTVETHWQRWVEQENQSLKTDNRRQRADILVA